MSTAPRRALVVIDVQNEYFTGKLPIDYPPPADSLANIARVMDAARGASIPIAVVQHTAPAGAPIFDKGTPTWELHPEIASRPRDLHFEKALASAYTGTPFAKWLADNRIDTLVVVGYMTHNCVASTVFEAQHSGLNVEVLSDATGALPYENRAGGASGEEIHRSFQVVFQSNFAAVLSTEEWIANLASGKLPERDNILTSNAKARARERAA